MKHLSNILVTFLALFILSCNNDPSNNNDSDNQGGDVDSTAQGPIDGDTEPNNGSTQSITDPTDLTTLKDVSKLNEAQLAVQSFLEACATKNFQESSKYLAYRGKDQSRMLKDHFNYSDANEKSNVDLTCNLIVNWLQESESYEFITYNDIVAEDGTTLNVVEVMFKKQELGVNRRFFDLIGTDRGYLIVAMR